MSHETYKYWDLFDELPAGWSVDKTCGSPLHGYVFCTNGRSAISGMQKRALVRAIRPMTAEVEVNAPKINQKKMEVIEPPRQEPDLSCRTAINELARNRFKVRLLSDIAADLMVCEIEGWSKVEYIKEIRELVNEIGCPPKGHFEHQLNGGDECALNTQSP